MTAKKNGSGAHARHRDPDPTMEPETPALDPIYDVPLLGRLVKEADDLRSRLPFGKTVNAREADLLRMEARALRLAAGYLEQRARQLDLLGKANRERERPVRRVTIE